MSTLQVVGGDATGFMVGTAEVDAPLSRDRYVVAWVSTGAGGSFGALRLVRLTPQEAAKRKRARRALRLDASRYARSNVALRGEVEVRPAPEPQPRGRSAMPGALAMLAALGAAAEG